MPLEVKPRFVVLYGSQKGQAQSIAEGIAEEAEEHGLVADLCCLNQNDKVSVDITELLLYCMSSCTQETIRNKTGISLNHLNALQKC